MTTLRWSRKFPLHHAFTHNECGGGIYMWGFDGFDGEVVWYVGKATSKKGIMRRLRNHYLNIMSAQYQIPKGFLNGEFRSADCSFSGWAIDGDKIQQAVVLQDWSRMQEIFRAGHAFANGAFARIAVLNLDDEILKRCEQIAIYQLNPIINKQRARTAGVDVIEMVEAPEEAGWISRWISARQIDGRKGLI